MDWITSTTARLDIDLFTNLVGVKVPGTPYLEHGPLCTYGSVQNSDAPKLQKFMANLRYPAKKLLSR